MVFELLHDGAQDPLLGLGLGRSDTDRRRPLERLPPKGATPIGATDHRDEKCALRTGRKEQKAVVGRDRLE
jgi:hypothetical protein